MTGFWQALAVAFFVTPRDGSGTEMKPRPRYRVLATLLPDRTGHVDAGSVEEQIWRELGALPASRRRWSGAGPVRRS
jgi:hypothetical protein